MRIQKSENWGMPKRQIKDIHKLIVTCSVQEDTDDYIIYTCDDKRHW